ncbi:MAG: integrase arm-type DNA-binding domain-containing protein [Sulfurovum sp.]|nr:integrase arm-type DNA-binding domain-containing protein [Sulfurovum sp.]
MGELSAQTVKNAKPKNKDGVLKDQRYPDGGGLYLLATVKGGKVWRYNFSMESKKYVYFIGKYPAISLADARKIHTELKSKIAKGINPVIEKREKKITKRKAVRNTFKDVAEDYLLLKKDSLAESTYVRYERALKRDFYPFIGAMPIDKITRGHLVEIATYVQQRGALETAHRYLNLANQIWKYALQFDKVEHNIVADIDKTIALKKFSNKKYKTITNPKRIGELLRAIDEYKGSFTTRHLLRFLPYVFVRSANIREAVWSEFDLEKKMWTIPANKMKSGIEHKLPLSTQAIAILEEVGQYTHDAKYVFHSPLSRTRPLTDVAVSSALKRLDFGDEIVPHGFRAMFSTIANEHGKESDVVEALLAHVEKDKIRGAYNRAEYVEKKKEVVQWYADYLEEMKNG